jgi:hypothetical protein
MKVSRASEVQLCSDGISNFRSAIRLSPNNFAVSSLPVIPCPDVNTRHDSSVVIVTYYVCRMTEISFSPTRERFWDSHGPLSQYDPSCFPGCSACSRLGMRAAVPPLLHTRSRSSSYVKRGEIRLSMCCVIVGSAGLLYHRTLSRYNTVP